MQDREAVANFIGLMKIVGTPDDGLSFLVGQGLAGEMEEFSRGDGVKTAGRLIEEKDLGAREHGPGNGEPLFLPSGIGHKTEVCTPFHVDEGKDLKDPLFFGLSMEVVEGGKEVEIFPATETPVKATFVATDQPQGAPDGGGLPLEAESFDTALATVGTDQGGQDLDEGRLAGPIGSQEPHDGTSVDRKGDPVEGLGAPWSTQQKGAPVSFGEGLGDIVKFYRRGHKGMATRDVSTKRSSFQGLGPLVPKDTRAKGCQGLSLVPVSTKRGQVLSVRIAYLTMISLEIFR